MPTATIGLHLVKRDLLRFEQALVKVVYWFATRKHCDDVIEAITTGQFGNLLHFGGAACGGAAVMLALRDLRIKHPRLVLILRVMTPCQTAFVNAEDILDLHPGLAPIAVIGSGRDATYTGWFGTKSIMRETLHMDCKFNGMHLSQLQAKARPGIMVMDLGFAYSPSENMLHAAAGVFFGFTTVVLSNPLVTGFAGAGIAVGKLWLPYGMPIKAVLGAGASRLGPLVRYLPLMGNNVDAQNVWGEFAMVPAPTRHLSPRDFMVPAGQYATAFTQAPAPLASLSLVLPSGGSSASTQPVARFEEIADSDDEGEEDPATPSEASTEASQVADAKGHAPPTYDSVDQTTPDWEHEEKCDCNMCMRALREHVKQLEGALDHLVASMPPSTPHDHQRQGPEDFPFLPSGPIPGSSKRTGNFKAALGKAKKAVANKVKGKSKM